MKKQLTTGFLILFAAAFVFSGIAKAEETAGSAAAQELQKVQEQTKAQADKLNLKKEKHQEIKDVRVDYKGQITDLRNQRKEALQAGNKDQAKALHQQIQAKKEEKKNKIQAIRKR